MAAMEKVTFAPLIAHLKESADEYNQLYLQQELKSGSIDSVAIARWVTGIIEPVVMRAVEADVNCLPRVFRVFYSNMLSLLGGNQALAYEEEYRTAWSICCTIPVLTARYPHRVLNALNSAIIAIRNYQPEQVKRWIEGMQATAPQCSTIEQFLDCGRVIAWTCGLAHLRANATKLYPALPDAVKTILGNQCGELLKDDLLHTPWGATKSLLFEGVAGGFTGLGHPFTEPPLVAAIDGYVIAADSKSSNVVFVDSFGTVLIRDSPYQAALVKERAADTAMWKLKEKPAFNDITSCVVLNDTLILTRRSSHYLFIYSCPNG
jgi:hypothetical protein